MSTAALVRTENRADPVQELIRHVGVARDLADDLAPMVRGKFIEIWDVTRRDDEE
jgi:hypothetical protein